MEVPPGSCSPCKGSWGGGAVLAFYCLGLLGQLSGVSWEGAERGQAEAQVLAPGPHPSPPGWGQSCQQASRSCPQTPKLLCSSSPVTLRLWFNPSPPPLELTLRTLALQSYCPGLCWSIRVATQRPTGSFWAPLLLTQCHCLCICKKGSMKFLPPENCLLCVDAHTHPLSSPRRIENMPSPCWPWSREGECQHKVSRSGSLQANKPVLPGSLPFPAPAWPHVGHTWGEKQRGSEQRPLCGCLGSPCTPISWVWPCC